MEAPALDCGLSIREGAFTPPAPSVERKQGSPPLWTKLGQRERFGDRNGRIALVDPHSPKCLRGERFAEDGGGNLDDLLAYGTKAVEAGFAGVSLCPINDTDPDEACHYMGVSSFSYDPSVVTLDRIPELWGLEEFRQLRRERAAQVAEADPQFFDHKSLHTYKLAALGMAYDRLAPHKQKYLEERVRTCDEDVLNGIVFSVLHERFKLAWWDWPQEYKDSNGRAVLEKFCGSDDPLWQDILRRSYIHFTLDDQWTETARELEQRGGVIAVYKPVYPQHDSAEAWAHRDKLFYMNPDGSLPVVSGCKSPGDPHGAQKWNHPVYRSNDDPEATEYFMDHLVNQVKHIARTAKVVYLDHVLALVWKYYVYANQEGAQSRHIEALKHRAFQRLKRECPDVSFIAEDIGYMNDGDVTRPLEENGMPGLRIPMHAWNKHQPDDFEMRYAYSDGYAEFMAALTDNHDTPAPNAEWWSNLPWNRRAFFLWMMYGEEWWQEHPVEQPLNIPDFIRMVSRSRAQIFSMTERMRSGDDRHYQVPAIATTPDQWSAVTPEKVSEMNFGPVSRILEETGRSARQLLQNGPILAVTPNPLMQSCGKEEQHRKPGESFSIRVALRDELPAGVTVYSNLPTDDHPHSSGPLRRSDLPPTSEQLSFSAYGDGTVIMELTLPIPPDASPGSYGAALNMRFPSGGDGRVCLLEDNFHLVVTED